MSTLSEVTLIVSSLLGAIGWFFAWRARGETSDTRKELEAEQAATVAAKAVAFTAGARAVLAETQCGAEQQRSAALTLQLATERKNVQTVVDALAKTGAPVGGLLVSSALDELYPDDRGKGSNSGPGGDPTLVPGPLTTITGASTEHRS